MSKKPKKSRHRVPFREMASDPITEDYQAEVDHSTAELERRYARAEKALERAKQKAERARELELRESERIAEQEEIAARRAEGERLLAHRIEQIKQAAQRSRVRAAQKEFAAQRADTERRRREQVKLRQQAQRLAREADERRRVARQSIAAAEGIVADRERELRELRRLMQPGNHAGSAHRGTRGVIHQTGRRM